MKAIGRFAGVFVALVIISGCGAQPWAPGSSPTGPGPGRGGGVGDPPVYGEITLKSVTHESGDTLLLQDCAVLRNQPAGQQLCNDQLRLTLEVAVDRDLQNLQLQVSFMEGDRRCGLASSFVFSASAHRLQSLTTSLVEFYGDQPEAGKPVDLGCHTPPLVTTRDGHASRCEWHAGRPSAEQGSSLWLHVCGPLAPASVSTRRLWLGC